VAKVRDLTGGDGTHVVIEAAGLMPAYEQAIGVVRPGGVIRASHLIDDRQRPGIP
jgi:threonine dehydrogenase-like Zn-dependent dehydrogenase